MSIWIFGREIKTKKDLAEPTAEQKVELCVSKVCRLVRENPEYLQYSKPIRKTLYWGSRAGSGGSYQQQCYEIAWEHPSGIKIDGLYCKKLLDGSHIDLDTDERGDLLGTYNPCTLTLVVEGVKFSFAWLDKNMINLTDAIIHAMHTVNHRLKITVVASRNQEIDKTLSFLKNID